MIFSNPLKIAFLAGWALYAFGLYTPFVRRYRKKNISSEFTRPIDIFFDMSTVIGWQVLPLLYVFTRWFSFADYHLPAWAGWTGVAIFAAALLVLRSAYTTLGVNWSPKIDVRSGQDLVTQGIFSCIRHPIYAGMWLWVIAQPLIIQNWVAGWAMGLFFLPLYITRVPREEAMLLKEFGERYRLYAHSTGRILPRISIKLFEKS
jgi:protein-S-isoprenylcysteine O-methyltransferase Ste14